MVTASCDAKNRDQRLPEVLNEGGLARTRRKTALDEHTELERSVEQLRHDHWRRCEI